MSYWGPIFEKKLLGRPSSLQISHLRCQSVFVTPLTQTALFPRCTSSPRHICLKSSSILSPPPHTHFLSSNFLTKTSCAYVTNPTEIAVHFLKLSAASCSSPTSLPHLCVTASLQTQTFPQLPVLKHRQPLFLPFHTHTKVAGPETRTQLC